MQPGGFYFFATSGSDLRWRAELHSLSPASTPRVEEIQITTQSIPNAIGDRVWDDLDGDGIQDAGEPGLDAVTVLLYSPGGTILDFAVTDTNGDYSFTSMAWGGRYSLRFLPPSGYALAPQDQGTDEALDSDADPVTGSTPVFTQTGFDNDTRWDVGMVLTACQPPDEAIYLYAVGRSTDGNDYPILNFMDFNQPGQVTGYNIYRSSDPTPPPASWPLVASDIVDGDAATPNNQWVDISGDVSPSDIWYYQVTAFNHTCPAETAEGPF